MLINFSFEGLATIICSRPNSEEYPVSNLLSKNPQLRAKGFMTDYFVKPPVDIVYKFPSPINLDSVIVNCAVGSQKSSVIRVSVVHENGTEKSLAVGEVKSSKSVIHFHRFANKNKCEPNRTYISMYNAPYFVKVAHLKITILRTESSTIPALGSVEIWGNVSKGADQQLFKTITKKWREIRCFSQSSKTPDASKYNSESRSNTCSTNRNTKLNSDVDFEVPEEFLDPITCELLTLPMTLPCGKVVDMTTLEKFYKSEAERGRGESDPFTGLPFTENRRPVFADALKVRLDKFLLENCNQPVIKDIPRTTGRKNNFPKPSFSNSPYDPSTPSSSSCTSGMKRPRDIDTLLESTLSGLPSYLEKREKKVRNNCYKCDSKETLYKLVTCDHIYCRTCLLSIKKSGNKCDCGCDIDFNNVVRYHPD